MIDHDDLIQLLDYDSTTGIFRWKIKRNANADIGSIAGSLDKRGYITITLKGKRYYAHRLVIFYVTGSWPVNQVDHKDRKKSNNSFDNLRDIEHTNNQWNVDKRKDNTSGYKGVSIHKRSGKYQAVIALNGKSKHIGYYITIEEAVNAYNEAAILYHGEYAVLNIYQ